MDSREQLRELVECIQRGGFRYSSYGMDRPAVIIRRTDGSYDIESGSDRFVGAKRERVVYDPQAYDSHFCAIAEPNLGTSGAIEIVRDVSRPDADRLDALDHVVEQDEDQAAAVVIEELEKAPLDPVWRRQLVCASEELQFSGSERERIARLLLDFILGHLDSEQPDDGPAVRSAIRTYASIINPDEAEAVSQFIASAHRVDVVLTVLKVVNRVFERHLPRDRDQYPALASAIAQIAQAHLNAFILARAENSAVAINALTSLAAIRSTRGRELFAQVPDLQLDWLTAILVDRLAALKTSWNSLGYGSVAGVAQSDLDEAIKVLDVSGEAD